VLDVVTKKRIEVRLTESPDIVGTLEINAA
jgi:hypothetical protein